MLAGAQYYRFEEKKKKNNNSGGALQGRSELTDISSSSLLEANSLWLH